MRRTSLRTGLYFVSLAALLTGYFELWRLVLLIATRDLAGPVPGSTLAGSFLVGLRFDFAVASYLMIALVVSGMLPGIDIGISRRMRRVHAILLGVFLAIVTAAYVADMEFFRFFNVRLNGSALLWKDYPSVALPMLWKMYPVVAYFLLYATLLTLVLWAAARLRRGWLQQASRGHTVSTGLVAVALILVFLLGARGRIEEKSPIRWGLAYFSDHDYANQLALNPSFTFFQDVLYNVGSAEQIHELMSDIADPDAPQIAGQLLDLPIADSQRIHHRVTFTPENPSPPNVIVVIMESFGATGIGVLDNALGTPLSPCFDSLADRGVLFTNAYSAGEHTYAGLFSTLYGYPPGFGNLVMKENRGRSYYWGLPQVLRQHGYRTVFFTTSDPHFDNMQGFLMANGIEEVSSLYDYDPALKLSTLGVADHVMFDHAVDVLRDKNDQPFFATLLTGSNHGPWILPDVDYGALPDGTPDRKRLNAFKYSDWALGRFVHALESDPTFDNTLLVVTADNGLLHTPQSDLDLSQYHIPILLYRIGEPVPAARPAQVASQTDIVATVMGQIGLDYDDYTFGRDLLDSSSSRPAFALFSEWYKIGFIENGYYAITRLGGPSSLYAMDDPTRDIAGKLPDVTAAVRRRALALYQTAYHNARLPLHGLVHATAK